MLLAGINIMLRTNPMRIRKYSILASVILGSGLLTGCVNALNSETITLDGDKQSPAVMATFDDRGNLVNKIKTSDLKISSDKNIDQAIKVQWGQNKTIANNTSVLAYVDTVNYVTNNTMSLREIYDANKSAIKDDDTVVVVKNKQDAIIGLFSGQSVHIKAFDADLPANAKITIDGGTVFVYDGAYETYPASTIEAMTLNQHAKQQKTTKDVTTSNALDDSTKK